ncbi:MAG: hypothetical protein HYX74_10560 [Acidobacteria bacterium]|nr:hypothetical protein [Acidobacteriota bacterium]
MDRAGNLRNVFVYIKEGLPQVDFPAPSEPLVLEQRGCVFRPRVVGVRVGQKLVIRNNDDAMHSVQALAGINRPFTLVQPFHGMFVEKTFDKPEMGIRIKCQFHPWMVSYLSVIHHPFFAVTGGDGRFSIPHLPPGDYLLEAWHEILGTQTQRVRLRAGEAVEVSVNFAPRK